MQASEETNPEIPVVVRNISHRWLRWLDERIGKLREDNGCFADVTLLFRGKRSPATTKISADYPDALVQKSLFDN